MDINKPTDSEYIEMTRRGLDINMEDESDYDVIPANFLPTKSAPVKHADEIDFTPVSCHPPDGRQTTQNNADKDLGTMTHVGGSRWRTYFRLGLGVALVFLSVGVTLVIIHTVFAEMNTNQNELDPAFDRNSGSFDDFSSIPNIPKRITATISTDAKRRQRVLRLTPANGKPLDFTYKMRNPSRYPFLVNRRGMLTVRGTLAPRTYEFTVKIKDRRSNQSVKVTVVIICQSPSLSVFFSNTIESSFLNFYTHFGVNSISTVFPQGQESEEIFLTPTPSFIFLSSDFRNPISGDASSKTMIHTHAVEDASSKTTIHTRTVKYVAMTVGSSSDVFSSSFPEFSTVFSVTKQVSAVQIMCSTLQVSGVQIMYSTFDSHYLDFSSMPRTQTDLMQTLIPNN